MLKNYLKIAFRNITRQKLFSFINIFGLAIGLAVFIMIIMYVQSQLSYDKYNLKLDRIYRAVVGVKVNDNEWAQFARSSELSGPEFKNQFSQIESVARIEKHDPDKAFVTYNDKRFYEGAFLHTNSAFFDVFTFNFVEGSAANALSNPNSIVITSSIAKKYFGNEDALGKVLRIDNKTDYSVTGVISDVPYNSHFHFDFLANKTNWENTKSIAYTYILLKKGNTANDLERQFPAFIDKYFTHTRFAKQSDNYSIILQPLASIHLHSNINGELEPNSDIRYVTIFTAIAFFILLIGCINYTNIATSKYLKRITEIGVRKALGANKHSLATQIFAESITLSFISLILAIGMVELTAEKISNYTGIIIPALKFQANYLFILSLLLITFVTGILSGAYPAFYVSRFSAAQILRKSLTALNLKFNLRKVLIVVQFAIAVLIITATFIFKMQLNFIENKRLGFDKENVVIVDDQAGSLSGNYNAFKNNLHQSTNIASLTSGDIPGPAGGMAYGFLQNGKPFVVRVVDVDNDYLQTLGMQLKEGRGFNSPSDTSNIVINETGAKSLARGNVIGLELGKTGRRSLGKIIGIVKDFNINSLKEKIMPVVIRLRPSEHSNVLIKVRANKVREAINEINNQWSNFVKERPIQYSFLNDVLNGLYISDEKITRLFGIFAFVSIFLACLGLFGVSALVAEQRTKEMGIRKILGASVQEIIYLISKEFVLWIIIANIISIPIAYYFMNKWLQEFAYRIDLGGWIFLLIVLVSLTIAFITIGFHAIKVANSNPAEILKCE